MISLADAFMLVSKIFSFGILLQAIEMTFISRDKNFLAIWNFQNIESTLTEAIPFSKNFLKFIFSQKSLTILALTEFALATSNLFYFNALFVLFIAVIQLIICIRFRGIFNGGSDMMSFVLATGLIIGGKIGLIYIAIHAGFSYFKAGLVKVVQPLWLQGNAISDFLQISLFQDTQLTGKYLQKNKYFSFIFSWLTLIFELAIPVILFYPKLAFLFFGVAFIFHLVIYFAFGLNRFFWMWLATWPAICFSVGLL